jgi:hypothetical protein
MTTYCDLKLNQIWSDDNIKNEKYMIKTSSFYFRAVKQGSIVVYLTFHIMTIFVVLIAALMRQSVQSIVYVMILLPHTRSGGEVLDQRLIT